VSREGVVRAEIKFCGMTRAADVREAVHLGATYVGVIRAGGPRLITVERAQEVLASASDGVRRVGVYGPMTEPTKIAEEAQLLELHAVQLHSPNTDRPERRIDALRLRFAGEIWIALRIADGVLPEEFESLIDAADAVVLDSFVPGSLGGTGTPLPWKTLASALADRRGRAKLILAGGLRPENVQTALETLRPDVVDVSSGIESAPGIKDHMRMRAFRDAVLATR
jgi:phosphoribosylanthranilate isomerase